MRQALLALFLTVAALRADVTIRYQTELKAMPALQPLLEKLIKSQGSETTVRMKGDNAVTTSGKFTEIFDFVKQEVTVMDSAHKQFAVLPVSQLADTMSAAMPQVHSGQVEQFLASLKTKADSRMTGQTATIQGVQAEERELTISLDLPSSGTNQAGITMKMVMHVWTAKPGEALKVPAIRELTGYNAWQKYILNPTAMLEKMAGRMPGVSETLRPLMDEMTKSQAVILRTHMELYSPLSAMMAQKMAQPGQDAPPVDASAPFMEVSQEVAELSSAPVDAALFEVPKEYTSVPAADLFGAMMHAQPAGAP